MSDGNVFRHQSEFKLRIRMVCRKRIYHGCSVRIEKPIRRDHCSASRQCLVMPNNDPRDRFFYSHLIPMKDYYILSYPTEISTWLTRVKNCHNLGWGDDDDRVTVWHIFWCFYIIFDIILSQTSASHLWHGKLNIDWKSINIFDANLENLA